PSARRDVESLVAAFDKRPEFVNGKEIFDPVAELFRHITGIVGKSLGRVPVLPAPLILQCLWQVPMVQGNKRLGARRLQFVYQPAVEVQSLDIWLACSFRKDPWPGDRKAISRGPKVGFHRCHVFLPQVIVVIGNIAIVIVLYMPRFGYTYPR